MIWQSMIKIVFTSCFKTKYLIKVEKYLQIHWNFLLSSNVIEKNTHIYQQNPGIFIQVYRMFSEML